MIVDCISDLHGYRPNLSGGDLLIIAGDLTATDTASAYRDFAGWLRSLDYETIIIVPGNHDGALGYSDLPWSDDSRVKFLCDSGVAIKGYQVWGSPWTLAFPGQHPSAMAYALDNHAEIDARFELIPEGTNILVTHAPPYGIRDCIEDSRGFPLNVGSQSLLKHVKRVCPELHVYGHIHEGYGECPFKTHFVNASQVDKFYNHVNKPIRIHLCDIA